ncbi:hypothetical protein K504DRAFT_530687 [Pleomassaria siparia CBS 279.74]|uniref:Uncharacterized protein n=1 Tax=Pleomassaria siparia CBS 279.74 TaxID=1314801 RepID=A0A6G1KMY1_9PLEO|nr:hypothetical protein K504DRAFT_530687 [Pleomassaria siparia CBS 279.74]
MVSQRSSPSCVLAGMGGLCAVFKKMLPSTTHPLATQDPPVCHIHSSSILVNTTTTLLYNTNPVLTRGHDSRISPPSWLVATLVAWAVLTVGLKICRISGVSTTSARYAIYYQLRLFNWWTVKKERFHARTRSHKWPGHQYRRGRQGFADLEARGVELHNLGRDGRRKRNRRSVDSEDGLDILGFGRTSVPDDADEEEDGEKEGGGEETVMGGSSAMAAYRKTWAGENGVVLHFG